jgi:hypothetical protein
MDNLLYTRARLCLSNGKKNVQEEEKKKIGTYESQGWKQTKAPPAHWSVKIIIIVTMMTSILPKS